MQVFVAFLFEAYVSGLIFCGNRILSNKLLTSISFNLNEIRIYIQNNGNLTMDRAVTEIPDAEEKV